MQFKLNVVRRTQHIEKGGKGEKEWIIQTELANQQAVQVSCCRW